MKVVAVTIPLFGHFHPMLPLARALVEAEHEVLFITSHDFAPRVRTAGFDVREAGPTFIEARDQVKRLFPNIGSWQRGFTMFAKFFAPAVTPSVIEISKHWGANLIFHETTALSAPLAAAKLGIACVEQSFGLARPARIRDLGADLVVDLWKEYGVDPETLRYRDLYIDVCPPTLQSTDIEDLGSTALMRPIAMDATGEKLTDSLNSLPNSKTVYVTLGTVFNENLDLFSWILDAVRDLPVNVILTLGLEGDPSRFGPQPPNVLIEKYIPQSLVFERCDVVVCHGDSGTMLSALAMGLPLLMLPQGADQFMNSAACVAAGVALSLEGDEQNADRIRTCIEHLLADPTFRQKAKLLQTEIAEMPAASTLVPTLENLAQKPRPLSHGR